MIFSIVLFSLKKNKKKFIFWLKINPEFAVLHPQHLTLNSHNYYKIIYLSNLHYKEIRINFKTHKKN